MVDIRSGFTFYLLKKEKNPVSSLPCLISASKGKFRPQKIQRLVGRV